MKEKQDKIDRRSFFKTIGAAGLGSALVCAKGMAGPNDPNVTDPNAKEKIQKPKLPQVPRRKLGKIGVEIPCLALGAIGELIVLRKALEWGVNHWDTSLVAAGGNSEISIGKYISKNPEVRKELFIVTKESDSKTAADLEKCLQTSLKRMHTKYVDLYFGIYRMHDPGQLTDEVKKWAEDAKRRKLIRFFGFSTHKNMSQCLSAAATCGWVDAIQTSYNFRLMKDDKMQAAIEACYKAGIGLIAMKTQAKKINADEDKKLTEHFLKQGFTEGQAKIKAVLEDKRISSACVAMQDVVLLTSNVVAVLDKTKLSQTDIEVLDAYAQASCSGYCVGCAYICNSALPNAPYVSDIMRYLMYYNSCGEYDKARKLFAEIPSRVRNKLLATDYRLAEARCPQHLPIGKLVTEAVNKLA